MEQIPVVSKLPEFLINYTLANNFNIRTSLVFLKEKKNFAILRTFENDISDSKCNENEIKFLREIEILSNYSNPLFVKILLKSSSVSNLKKQIFILLDIYSNGDLSSYIISKECLGLPLDENETFNSIYKTALAIKFLHDNKIIHRDIKPQNIFVGDSNDIRLGDFGLSRFFSNTNSGFFGSAGYIPPEVLRYEGYTFASDIFSFGATIFYINFKKRPFTFEKSDNKANQIVKNTSISQYIKQNIDKYCENEEIEDFLQRKGFYNDLIIRCMNLKQEERPNIDIIINELEEYAKTNENIIFPIEFQKSNFLNGSIEQFESSYCSSFASFCLSLYEFEINHNIEKGFENLRNSVILGNQFAFKYHENNIKNNIYLDDSEHHLEKMNLENILTSSGTPNSNQIKTDPRN